MIKVDFKDVSLLHISCSDGQCFKTSMSYILRDAPLLNMSIIITYIITFMIHQCTKLFTFTPYCCCFSVYMPSFVYLHLILYCIQLLGEDEI
jgi:hypothetical protein